MNLTPEIILLIITQFSSVGAMIVVNRTDIKWIRESLKDQNERLIKLEDK